MFLDRKARELVLRIAYAGQPLSGKTQSIRSLVPLLKGAARSDIFSAQEARGRTLYFDWASYTGGSCRGNRLRCQIVTVPGQEALVRRRKLLVGQADVVVFVLDSGSERLQEARGAYLEMLPWLERPESRRVPIVIQCNKRDLPGAAALDRIRAELDLGADAVLFESTATSGKGIRSAFNAAIRSALAYADELAESELNVAPEAINGEQLLELMHRVETDEVGSRSEREAAQQYRSASANLVCIDHADLRLVEPARSSASLDVPAPALNVFATLHVSAAICPMEVVVNKASQPETVPQRFVAEVPAQSEEAASIVRDRTLGEAIERRQIEIFDWRGDPGPAVVPTADRHQFAVPVDKAERAEATLVAESQSAAETEPGEPSCSEDAWPEEGASRAAIPISDSQSLSFSVAETGPVEAIITVESNSAADTQPLEPSTDELAWSDEGPTRRPRGREGTRTLAPLDGIGSQQEISPPEDDSLLEKLLEPPTDPNDGAVEVEMDFPPVLGSHAPRASESEPGPSMRGIAPPVLTLAVSSHGEPAADEGTALTSPEHESEAAVAEILAEESAQQDPAESAHAESVLLPNAEQSPEDVWPLEVWREVCSQIDSSPPEASWENGFWTGELAPRWPAVSSTSFGDRESGRAALRSAVERHECLQTYLWPHRCLVLSPDGPDCWRLWEIVSAAVSLEQILRRILAQEVDPQQTARGLMMVCNSYLRTTRQFAAAPEFLEASFNCVAPFGGRLVYAGLLLDTQPPEGVTGKPMDLLETELRLHFPINLPQTMDVQAVSREMIDLVYNGEQAEIAELLCSLLVGH